MTRLAPLLLVLLAASCGRDASREAPGPLALDPGWQTDRARIVSISGHAFENPSTGPRSILGNQTIDLARLAKLETHRCDFTASQRARLLSAALDAHPPVSAAACYIPHHIFLFHDARGHIIGSVEVCFSCRDLFAAPGWPRHLTADWMALAELCEELGLGLGPEFDSLQAFEEALAETGGP